MFSRFPSRRSPRAASGSILLALLIVAGVSVVAVSAATLSGRINVPGLVRKTCRAAEISAPAETPPRTLTPAQRRELIS